MSKTPLTAISSSYKTYSPSPSIRSQWGESPWQETRKLIARRDKKFLHGTIHATLACQLQWKFPLGGRSSMARPYVKNQTATPPRQAAARLEAILTQAYISRLARSLHVVRLCAAFMPSLLYSMTFSLFFKRAFSSPIPQKIFWIRWRQHFDHPQI